MWVLQPGFRQKWCKLHSKKWPELPKCILRNYTHSKVSWLDLWFTLLACSSFYAAIGAAVDNQTDSQQFLLPIIMPLMLSVYVGFYGYQWSARQLQSFLHDSAYFSIVMLCEFRLAYLWQIISVTYCLVASLCRLVCCKVYRIGIHVRQEANLEWNVSLVEILNKARFSFVKLN
jgi:hypothetical protein